MSGLRLRAWIGAVIVVMGVGVAVGQPKLASEAGAAASEPAASLPAAAPMAKQSFLDLLMRGGWAMIPLGACSLMALALMIERGLALRKSQLLPGGFIAGLEQAYRSPRDLNAALEYCQKSGSSVGRIMAAGLRKLGDGTTAAEQAISDQGATEVARMRRNLRLLHGIAAITPTLGLLGTVWGMIRAFEAASLTGLGVGHSEMLTKGIYEALVATMTGLMVAVPVLLLYYVYLGIIDRAVIELNDVTQGFMEKLEHGGMVIKAPGVPGEPADMNSTAATSNAL
jgi:biopolymer transport protein ExbB